MRFYNFRVLQFFLIVSCFCLNTVSSASAVFEPSYLPTLNVTAIEGEIRIDGDLRDSGWRNAARATNFAEVNPGDQVEPSVKSEAWVTYSKTHLYIALIAYDNPSEIRVSMSDRDKIFRDDYFGLMLDTYGDASWGYELFVNPIGIQGDLKMISGGNEDISFDIVWETRGQVTDSGYQVELAIPFASLRFPDKEEQVWRINFWRDHQREIRRRYAWAAQDRDNPCFLCQWGYLKGIRGIKPATNIDILPNVVATQSGALADSDDPSSKFTNGDPKAELSLTVRYGLSSNSSAEIAINPDFSQVESDAALVDVNTTFALFFPERRPFFQEGADLWNTWINAVYTRSINDPQVATKLTGRFGRTAVAYLAARDENSFALLPFGEGSATVALGRSISNIFRIRQSILEDSHVGFLVTDRRLEGARYDGGANGVLGTDAAFRFLKNYRLKFQVLASHTAEPDDTSITSGINGQRFDRDRHTADFDGEKFWGNAVYASFERSARVWNFDFDYWEFSPTFRADNGFVTQNDQRRASFWTGTFFRPNRQWLITWNPSISSGRIWNHDGRFKDEWVQPGVNFGLRGQTDISLNYLWSRERFDGIFFDGIRRWTANISSRFSKALSGGIWMRQGQLIARNVDPPVLGNATDIEVWGTLRPTSRLRIEPNFVYAKMDHRNNGPNILEGYLFRVRTNYQITREWFVRLVVQYNNFSERLDIEPLLTYRINPFTVFFVGSTHDLRDYEGRSGFTENRRQFFAKFQYLVRL